MPTWVAILMAVLGVVAAGAAFYVLGRRSERRIAQVTADRIGKEQERLLEEARARFSVTAREELAKTRETLEQEIGRRRTDVDRREAAIGRREDELGRRDQELGRRDQSLKDREKQLSGKEQEARSALERIAGLSAESAKDELRSEERRVGKEGRGGGGPRQERTTREQRG